jgi:hypothetical protein
MYSQAKEQLERERSKVVPPQVVEQAFKPEDLPARAKAVQDILKSLEPLLESREKQTSQLNSVCKAIDQYGDHLLTLTDEFHSLQLQLQELIALKNPNAEKERLVLNKLMEVL